MASVGLSSLRSTLDHEIHLYRRRVLDEDLPELKSLLKKLAPLQFFLDKFYIKAQEDDAIKDVELRIKDFAIRAEDKLELHLRTILLTKDSDRREEFCRDLRRIFGEMREEIDDLFRMVKPYTDAIEEVRGADEEFVPSEPKKENDEMVGHREELDGIKNFLLRDDSKERKIVSAAGMGGIGKTTLARTVYEEPIVVNHFDVRAWATVSQQREEKHVIIALIRCIKTLTPEEIKKYTKEELKEQLQKLLKGRRYLIVVDDVWSEEAWDGLNMCFPDKSGGRILVTTRIKAVAEYTGPVLHYDLQLLNSEDSLVLFCKKPDVGGRYLSSDDFKKVGEEIVEKCKGLPLSIVVVAGLLASKTSLNEWEDIKKELPDHLKADEQCSRIVVLSYKHLPPHLRSCFLNLSVFPEDSEMPIKKLIRLWIAEGFVKLDSHKSLEDNGEKLEDDDKGAELNAKILEDDEKRAEEKRKRLEEVGLEYLQDLVRRSIVLVRDWGANGKIKTCSMHDLIHDFCVNSSEKENYLYAGSMRRIRKEKDSNNQIKAYADGGKHEGFRWLSFWPNYGNVYFCYNLEKSRSLAFLHKDAIPTLVGQCLPSNLLRVLDLVQLPPLSNGVFRSLRGLVLLRYVDITLDDYLSPQELTNIASKTQNLQTLIVSLDGTSTFWSGSQFPSKIWESPQLSHVEVSHNFTVGPPTKVNKRVHTVYWLSLDDCTKEVLERIPNVKKLGFVCESVPNSDGIESTCLENVVCLKKLETLMIAFRKDSPSGFRNLDSLPLFLNIKRLKLKRIRLPWSEINKVGKLPYLEVLKLKEVCDESHWEPDYEAEFKKLKFLHLEAKNLDKWDVIDGEQFHCIEQLVLKSCLKLEAIPDGLAESITLKSIMLRNCSPDLLAAAKGINENRVDYGYDIVAVRHVDLIQEDDDDDEDEDEEEADADASS